MMYRVTLSANTSWCTFDNVVIGG